MATCLCEYLSPALHETSIIIIQCGKESRHPKNTANLLPLISDQIRLIQDTDNEALLLLKKNTLRDPDKYALLFPAANSTTLFEYTKIEKRHIEHLIVIDGTWRKAKRYYFENEWLHSIRSVRLSKEYESLYSIRKTSVTNGLSTLEAVAHSLAEIENMSIKPFLQLLNGINTVFTRHMPDDVKQRYD